MRIDQSTRDGCAILAPVGELDLAAVPPLRQLLLKRLAEQPVAVICDLAGLWSLDPACATVFATVANHPASGWPETTLPPPHKPARSATATPLPGHWYAAAPNAGGAAAPPR